MSNPYRTLFWMAAFLAAAGAVVALLLQPLLEAFMANWVFNGLILGVLLIGLIVNLRQVVVLRPEIAWIEQFRTGNTGLSLQQDPHLLKPLARHLHGRRKDRFRLSALSLRTVLDGIRARLDESREISRYIVGLLIFLGLLGTFWGLLDTVGAVARVIAGLDVSGGAVDEVFTALQSGLEAPLAGMGTAFSSSLFGLGGSLVLGFVDLQAGHAQNRFFDDLEEWLTGVTQLIDDPDAGAPPRTSPLVEPGGPDALEPLLAELRAQRRVLEALLAAQETTTGRAPPADTPNDPAPPVSRDRGRSG